jgi:hypothetical protein
MVTIAVSPRRSKAGPLAVAFAAINDSEAKQRLLDLAEFFAR